MAALGLLLAWLAQSLIFAVLICAAATQAMINVQLSLRQCQQQALAYTLIQLASGIAATVLTVVLLEFTDGWPIEKRFAAIFLGNLAVGLGHAGGHGSRQLGHGIAHIDLAAGDVVLSSIQ